MAKTGLKILIAIFLLIFVFFAWVFFFNFLFDLIGDLWALISIPISIVLYIFIIKIIFKSIDLKDSNNDYTNIVQYYRKKFNWRNLYKLKAGGYFALIFIILITIIIVTMDLFIKNTNPLTEKWLSLFFFFEMGALALVVGVFRGWYIDNSYAKSIAKNKKEYGEDYLDETVRRFKEKYPDNKDINVVPQDGISYFYSIFFSKS